jgi:hypothetical protein
MTFVEPEIKTTTTVPEPATRGGRHGGENPYQKFMMDMPEPTKATKNKPSEISWFFVPAEISETVTDPDERVKAQKTNTQKLVNRFTSIARRIRKKNGDTHDFAFRKQLNEETGEWGIVVYRIEPTV